MRFCVRLNKTNMGFLLEKVGIGSSVTLFSKIEQEKYRCGGIYLILLL